MITLALDSGGKTASAAIYREQSRVAEVFINAGLTHSQTLMPAVENLMRCASVPPSDINLIAVTVGPGSFTGIRIAVSAAKGLALANNIDMAAVSTLEALSMNINEPGAVIPLLDARRNQFYTAAFKIMYDEDYPGKVRSCRIMPDSALSFNEIASQISVITDNIYRGHIYLLGDGAELFYSLMQEKGLDISNVVLVPEEQRYVTAGNVALCGLNIYRSGGGVKSDSLIPVYLRKTQAEREREERNQQ